MSRIITLTLNPSINKYGEIDRIKYNSPVKYTQNKYYAGGKGINVSRIVNRFGIDTVCLGFAGNQVVSGQTGSLLVNLLNQEKIPSDFTFIEGETRSNMVVFEKKSGHEIIFSETGPFADNIDLENLFKKIESYISSDSIFVLSGSIPPGINETVYVKLIRFIKGKVRAIYLDADKEVMKDTILDLMVDFIKPSQDEIQTLVGKKIKKQEDFLKVLKYLNEFIRFPMISTNDYGLYFLNEKEELNYVVPSKFSVFHKEGVSDSVAAGFLIAYSERKSLEECVRFGVACGSATALISGPGMCYPEDSMKILKDIRIKKINV